MTEQGKKKLPVGIENFAEIRNENFYYVDKTSMIRDLLSKWGKVNLFTRPRRFGKSLNMSMLKAFFETGSDPAIFHGLDIAKETALCQEYMGKYPVISISLKSVSGRSFDTACAALRTVIGSEALRFRFLKDSDRLSSEEKALYAQLTEVGSSRGGIFAMSDEAMTAGLRTLSQLLFRHYGRKAILLIDEYDVPLEKAFQNGCYEEMVSLIRSFLENALKTNDSLYFAVLTGCLRISKESIFTGLNNLKVHSISDVRYEEYFGFTEDDVDELLSFYGLSSRKKVFQEWYDGYLFGSRQVYCPWDVINYCDELLANTDARPRNYWANTSGNAMVQRFIGKADKNTKEEIEQLLDGQTVLKPIREELTYPELDESIRNLWSVLYATGYLTGQMTDQGEEDIFNLKIPNKEIRKLFADLVKSWFQETALADSAKIQAFCAAFPAGDAPAIQNLLHGYLWESISVRDTAVRSSMKENFYHGMVLGLLRSQDNWLIQSNAETGDGYSDITICTPEQTGIVIELKYAESGNLEAACKSALQQIEDRKYDVGLRSRGMKKIVRFAMAFYKKECMVAVESD